MEDKNKYTTSEAAKRLGVAPSTLRYWESELNNIIKIKRNSNGYRQYSNKDIELLIKIKSYLYEQKYSIKQVREILNIEESKQDIAATLIGSTDSSIGSLVSVLLEKLDNIEDNMEELKEGQKNLKHEYLQAIKLLNITAERRDRKLIREIRQRLDKKKEQNKSFLQKLLPWGKDTK
ncbi:MAG: MerR family transcriptional regulator [Halanaerobiales bacterium]